MASGYWRMNGGASRLRRQLNKVERALRNAVADVEARFGKLNGRRCGGNVKL